MGLQEGPLTYTEIESSLEYELESETSIGSILLLYTLSLSTPLPSSSLLSLLLPPPYNMSLHNVNLEQII